MKADDLKKLIEYGADIEFSYRGKDYTMLPWVEDGISVGLQGYDEDDHIFKDFDDLMDNHVIDGVKFREAVEDINILFTSGC